MSRFFQNLWILGLAWAVSLAAPNTARAIEFSDPNAVGQFPPDNIRVYAPAQWGPMAGRAPGYLLHSGPPDNSGPGAVQIYFPPQPKPTRPLVELTATFNFSFFNSATTEPSNRLAFSYADFSQGPTTDGSGLNVIVDVGFTNQTPMGAVRVVWLGQVLAEKTGLPLQLDLTYAPTNLVQNPASYATCNVRYTPANGLSVTLLSADGRQSLQLVSGQSLDWNPTGVWNFGFTGQAISGASNPQDKAMVQVNEVAISGITRPFVIEGRIADEITLEGYPETFIFDIDYLEAVPLESIVVTLKSGNEAIIPSSSLSVSNQSPNTRLVTMSPILRTNGVVTITVLLDPGGGLPTATYTYQQTINPTYPPNISPIDNATQPQGFTRVVPFTVESDSWLPTQLQVGVIRYPTNLVLGQNIFVQPADTNGSNWQLFYTPAPGPTGSGDVVVQVSDPAGNTANSRFTLTTTPREPSPTSLGAGTALALNQYSPGVRQYAADTRADDMALGANATIEAWVFATALPDPSLNVIAAAGLPGTTTGLILALQQDGSPSLANWLNDFYPVNASVKVTTNHWHHVAGVVAGQSVTLYVDGQISAKGTLAATPNVQAGVVFVGHEPLGDGLDRPWYGFIDSVRIWRTARSASDIAANYLQVVPSDAPGLLRDFRCDDGFLHFDGANTNLVAGGVPLGGSLQDFSVQQRHAPLIGFPSYVAGVSLGATVNVAEDVPSTLGLGATTTGNAAWGSAGVTREIFFGNVTGTLADGLLKSPGWPNQPDVVLASAQGLELPTGGRTGYGQRMRGYLLPPETGNYAFAIASANEGELWLSSDETVGNLRPIARSPGSGVSFRRFDFNPSIQTAAATLTAGRRYYFEVRHQADNGANGSAHLSVRWTLPSGLVETPIPAQRTEPFGPAPANESLTYTVALAPATGTLTIANGVATYQPTANFVGPDSFAYRVQQGSVVSAPVLVNLNVVNQDDSPVAGSQNALRLGGAGGGIATADEFNLGGQSFTVELWANRSSANPPTGAQTETLWSLQSPLASPNAGLRWISEGSTSFLTFSLGNQESNPSTPLTLRTTVPYLDTGWFHWAATFDSSTRRMELFRNGVSLGNTNFGTSAIGVTNVQLFLGSFANAAGTQFSGSLDEVRLWNRVRTQAELLAQMGVSLVGNEDGLMAYYRLDEGNGLTAYDSSTQKTGGVRFNATITDPATWITGVTNLAWVKVARNSPGQTIVLPGFDFEQQALTWQIISPTPENGRLTQTGPGVFTYIPNPNFYGTNTIVYTVTAGGRTSVQNTLYLDVEYHPLPPTISSLRDVEFEEEDPPLELPFIIGSVDDPTGNSLTLVARSSNPALLPLDRIVFGGSGNARTVTLDPVDGEIGTSEIELVVGNGQLSAVTSFTARVNPRLAYVVVNAGAVTTQPSSVAAALNQTGQLAGWVTGTTAQTNSQPFLYTGYGEEAAAFVTDNIGGTTGGAFGLNNAGIIVGASAAPGGVHAFLINPRRDTQPTDLGVLVGGNLSVATAINDEGLIVGYAQEGGGTFRAFTAGTGPLTALPLPDGYTSQWATAVNAAGQIAGFALSSSGGATNGFLNSFGQNQDLGRPAGADHVIVTALNDEGVVFGHALYPSGAASRAVRWDSGQWVEIGDVLGGGRTEVTGANRYGQLVGRALTTNGVWHAFLYTDGRAFDLNALQPAGSNWSLSSAAAINDRAQIAVTGSLSTSPPQALLLFPATEIGRRVFRPEGTLAEFPQITILQGGGNDETGNSFYWSAVDQKLFAIRPVVAEIQWRTGTYVVVTNLTEFGDNVIRQKFTNEVLLPTLSFNIWPADPDIHVVGTPVQVEPDQPGFQHGFVNLIYTTGDGAQVDGASKVFTSPSPGYSVLQYLQTGGRAPNPQLQSHEFKVARSVLWNDPLHFVTNTAWTVGVPLTNALHNDYPGLNGFAFLTNAPYDGFGPNAAYDRATRKGPLLPVNTTADGGDLVVVWYRQNRLGVAWSSLPTEYSVSWPTNADVLVIASQLGSGPLSGTQYPQAQVYQQPDAAQPGFNPNEEHALLSAGVLYALRNDLNSRVNPKASDPYVLLKYLDPASTEWRMKVFSVVDEQAPYFFRFDGVAGNEIQIPAPLSALPILQTQNRAVSGPAWQDVDGRFYARAAGLDGGEGDVVMQYFYPLQPGFFYDLNRDGKPQYQPGDAVPWLDQRPGGIAGTPISIPYAIRWPAGVPPLHIGQSLTSATGGLPDIADMAAAQVVFDSLDPQDVRPINAAARLYDPLSPRTVKLGTGFQFPDSVHRSVDPGSGMELFPDLPYMLRLRLFHDPQNHLLGFRGYLYTPPDGGAPITLVNVMNSRERLAIAALDTSGGQAFSAAVTALFAKTRNPNDVDLDGNGASDEALLIGLAMQMVTNNGVVTTNIVRETLLGAKALTAGQPVPPLSSPPAYAVHFNGTDAAMEVGPLFTNITDNFTLEFWVRPEASRATTTESITGTSGLGGQPYAVFPTQGGSAYGSGHVGGGVAVGINGVAVFVHGDGLLASPLVYATNLTGWHQVAVVFQQRQPLLYLDGALVHVGLAVAFTVHPSTDLSRNVVNNSYGPFTGSVTDLRLWDHPRTTAEIAFNLDQSLTGAEAGLAGLWRFQENGGSTVANAAVGAEPGSLLGGFTWTTNAPPRAPAQRYVVIAENNDPSVEGQPVGLHVIRVDDALARGALAVIQPDNVLDERLTLRHTADFAGQPESFVFQWLYQFDASGFNPTNVPAVTAGGVITNLGAWVPYPEQGAGINDITLGRGTDSSLLTLSDTWWVMRYGMTTPDGKTNWSGWVGDPAGTDTTPRAMLVPGWIKRVLGGINLFAQRSSDFLDNQVNTLASTIAEAGPRYEGDVALNPNTLDNFGLIEIYETVLRRGRSLSIDGTPPVDFAPADSALLLAAGNIADLYLLHANEAFADAADPTIGLTTDSTELGSVASSVFAFENQLDSLLEEELAMLRGRDDRSAGVGAKPVYNRLFWNFTGGDGETAYVAKYGIPDQNSDGFINALDAEILYPQGHGDAWGHYLTAITTYYDLLRSPNFTWTPRAQSTLVAGIPIQVNYEDERRFASAAAARARTGTEVVDRTYRLNYEDDAVAQFLGTPDSDPQRAWSSADWTRRTALGAYFDWVTGNAILPPVDPDPTHTGIQRVDRTTVPDLAQLVTEAGAAVTLLDLADGGLSPMGLARGVVPFDIDPDLLRTGFSRTTHFEQIYSRALQALQNAETAFNRATVLSSELRKQQNSVSDFSVAVSNQELAYRNDLIQIFGYPYAGDLGAGATYPAGYVGPDLLHWMYVETLDVTAENTPRSQEFTDLYTILVSIPTDSDAPLSQGTLDWLNPANTNDVVQVAYPLSAADYGFSTPAAWGQRRAEGQLQAGLRSLVLAQAQLRQATANYANLVRELEVTADLLEARYNLKQNQLGLLLKKEEIQTTFDALILAAKATKVVADGVADDIEEFTKDIARAVPDVLGLSDDVLAVLDASVLITGHFSKSIPEVISQAAEIADNAFGFGKEAATVEIDRQMETGSQNFDFLEHLRDLEIKVRQEATLRVDVFNANQAIIQAARTVTATLAEGQRLLEQRTVFRRQAAGSIQADRYRDLGLRIFRNDALQKYDAQFELAARYVQLTAAAYDYELNNGNDGGAGSVLGAQIVRERNLGELVDGEPVVGRVGLASILGRMRQNFDVLKGQLGLNNDRPEQARFSLRTEAFRVLPSGTNTAANVQWRALLQQAAVSNLWDVPEFRRYCRAFAPESAGPQPGLVLRFGTTIAAGRNFFDQLLGPLDSSYDPSEYSTRIRSLAVWLSDYDAAGLAAKPRVYLVPVGADRLRAPDADDFTVYDWQALEQRIPIPFPITAADLANSQSQSLVPGANGSFTELRRHSAFRAYQDAAFDLDEFNETSRLVGRSVWNTQWVLIIPGSYLLGDSTEGINRFIQSVSDIKLYFQTYSASGN